MSLINITLFIFNSNDKELMYKSLKTDTYNNSIKNISYVIGIDPGNLHFIIDLFTREPSRIFRFEDKIPSVSPSHLKIKGNISKARLNLISEVFHIPIETTRKMGALWAYSQTMINVTTYKTVLNGVKENFITILGKDILKVDTGFLKVLLNMRRDYDNRDINAYFLSCKRDFILTLIDKTSSFFLEPGEGLEVFDNNLDRIWQWNNLQGKSFLSAYKKELENSSQEVQDIMNSKVSLPTEDLKDIFDILRKLARLIITKDLSPWIEDIGSNPTKMLFQDITLLFDEKYIDGILTLNMIYSLSHMEDHEDFETIKTILLPAIFLFNKSILRETFHILPPKNSLFKNLTVKLKELVTNPKALDGLEVSMGNMFHCLFESGFFDALCDRIFENDLDLFDIKIDHRRLVRLWLHLISDYKSREKIIMNFIKLDDVGAIDDLKVFFSLVRNDSTYEKLLKKFFREIGMPSKLGLNLLRVLDAENTSV